MSTRTCPSGHPNPEEQRFCGECGAPLEPPVVPEAPASEGGTPGLHVPVGGDPPRDTPGSRSMSSAKQLALLGGAAIVVLAVAAGVFILVKPGEASASEQYVDAIKEAGLGGEFASDRAAVIQGEAFCEDANTTGEPKGGEAEQIAVEHLCPEWEEDFRLLSTITVDGSFEVIDFDEYYLSDDGDSCEGEGGYGDINASTAVIVTNTAGDVLDRTDLGPGSVEDSSCVFEFEFEVTEGEDDYIVAVGDRGETSNTFEELDSVGVQLSLG